MSVIVCKRVFLVMAVVMLFASTALAAPANSGLVGNVTPSRDDSLEREIEDGIIIVAEGVRHNGKRDRIPVKDRYGNSGSSSLFSISLHCRITVPEDTTIKVGVHNIYDNLGHEFNQDNVLDASWNYVDNVLIGGQRTKERFIVGDTPTLVEIEYICAEDYKIAPIFPRVDISVNGQTVTFRNVPGKQ
jgi:hypothetical protein